MANLTAVICDDDPTIRTVLAAVLAGAGFEVTGEAAMAIEAIPLVGSAKPDVVVLDLALMGMSGLDAIPAIRAAHPGCVIVTCSAFDDPYHRLALAKGADHAVAKTNLLDLEHILTTLAAERSGADTPA